MSLQGLPVIAQPAPLPPAPIAATAGPAHHRYRLLTPEERAAWHLRWYWRKVKVIAACPPPRTLENMMRRNRGVEI